MGAARERVVVAMSGGVDSSLAAALLVEAGYDVVGVSMRLWAGPSDSGCCSLDDFLDARLVAERLGIPFYVMDFSAAFGRAVVDDFVAEYRRGRTPNPCARCNQYVKFAGFWDRARELGATRIATGHYARVAEAAGGAALLAGVDADKDQSYFLFGIDGAVLGRTLFPVGDLRKTEVRAEAARRGLPVAGKPDSQEVCFVPRTGYAAFVARHESAEPLRGGRLVDADGQVLAAHDGVHQFTIGQRRGLGIAGGEPRYVTAIEADGTVRLGGAEQVFAAGVVADDPNWLAPPPRVGTRVAVKIRSRFAAQAARVVRADRDGFVVVAEDELRAVTPGQAAVLYDGERVLGGGWIRAALRDEVGEGVYGAG
ncbi:MAG TPA: tRNA 2-thiouridine(34) synthase MnmA [Candidatus Dormibacteraeota bacterium]|nr:tRNA 2-thiouridine(34) synthase MnmA [Candidatus Dormibacteraeota bacterium]